jgi:hypothetical protein
MIVTRGLGRGTVLGSLVGFGLTREVFGDIDEDDDFAKSGKKRQRRRLSHAFEDLEFFFDEYQTVFYQADPEIMEEYREVVSHGHQLVTNPTLEVSTWQVPYTSIRKELNTLDKKVQKTKVNTAIKQEASRIIQTIFERMIREEEEILTLLEMEVI